MYMEKAMVRRESTFAAFQADRRADGRPLARVQEGFEVQGLIIRSDEQMYATGKPVVTPRNAHKWFVSQRLGPKETSRARPYEEICRAATARINRSGGSMRLATLAELLQYWDVAGRSLSSAHFDGLVALGTELFWPDQFRVAHPVLTYRHPDEDREDDPDAGLWLASRNTAPEYWPGFYRYLFVSCP